MSATIYWRPKEIGKPLDCHCPSVLVQALNLQTRAIVLTRADADFLRGLCAGNENLADAVCELQQAIETHGSIVVEAVF